MLLSGVPGTSFQGFEGCWPFLLVPVSPLQGELIVGSLVPGLGVQGEVLSVWGKVVPSPQAGSAGEVGTVVPVPPARGAQIQSRIVVVVHSLPPFTHTLGEAPLLLGGPAQAGCSSGGGLLHPHQSLNALYLPIGAPNGPLGTCIRGEDIVPVYALGLEG